MHRLTDRDGRGESRPPRLRVPGWVCVAGLAVVASSCSVVRHEASQSKAMIQSLAGKGGGARDPGAMARLQSEVMREADRYVAFVTQACDDFQAKVGTAEARSMALEWKLSQATAAYVNAAGPNPTLNTVDMVVLATVSRMVVEDHWVGEKFGEAARPLLDVQRRLETNSWGFIEGVLDPGQRQELQSLIQQWRRKNPSQQNVAAARLGELVKAMGGTAAADGNQSPASLFSLAFIDPLSGLDPAVRAVEQTRNLAERAMYYAERTPKLLSWQAELLTYQLADQPETKQVLSDAGRLTASAESFAKTAGELPQLVNDQREAAINQLLAGVASERSNILATLAAQETQLRELLPQVQQTLNAGADMANSVQGAVQSLDAFVRYVSPPDTNPPTAGTNSPPFNILDYGTAAGQIGGAARDLNTLLASLNQTVPRLEQLTAGAEADGERLVRHAFWRGVALVLIFLAGSVIAALAYRHVVRKWSQPP